MLSIQSFLDKEGRIKSWPSKTEKKLAVLLWLGARFETGRIYTEKEVNAIITEHHSFNDYFLLRRELINKGILCRTTNGARYWRGRLWPETESFATQRITLSPAAPGERDALLGVYQSCGYMAEWTGQPHTEESLDDMLANRDLPPNGLPEFSQVLSIKNRETGEVIGLAQYYAAYPAANRLWIGLFLLHPTMQRGGYGRECIEAMLQECRRQGYERVGLGVALRNQPAVKFWVAWGFDRISAVHTDDAESGHLAIMGLYQDLVQEESTPSTN